MAWRLSRREFLRFSTLSLFAAGSLFLPGEKDRRRFDPTTGIELDSDDETVSYHEAMQLGLKLAKAAHILKLATWRPMLTEDALLAWSSEVSLQMHAEGLVDYPPVPPNPTYFDPITGDQANHTLGLTDCETYIKLTARFKNQMADWYNSPDWPATVAHELVHLEAQGELCQSASSEQIEASATIGALVVLAAMANRGNGIAMRAFVWEFLDICMGSAYASALSSDQQAEYDRLRQLVYPGILSKSRYEKINREFAGREVDRQQILQKYYLLPLQIIMRSHLTNADRVEGLVLQPKAVYTGSSYTNHPVTHMDRTLSLQDWSWLMANLQQMSQAYADSPVDFIVR